jgi:hypothetical protein
MKAWKVLGGCAVALILLASPTMAAPAAPRADAIRATSADAPAATTVQWRRGGWYGRGWRGPGIGLGLGIIGGAIIANEIYRPRPGYRYDDYAYDGPYYYPSNYRGDPRRICAENFRSFEWNTGMYTTYSGERRLCPYLR